MQLKQLRQTKNFKKVIGWIASPFTIGLIVTLVFTISSLRFYPEREFINKNSHGFFAFLEEIHQKTIDWRLKDRGAELGSDRVAILAIDEEAINLEGHWPWRRDKLAKLIDRTLMYGAKSVSFDIIWSEEDNNAALPSLARIKRSMPKGDPSREPASVVRSAIEEEEAKSDFDRIFANTIKASAKQLILGSFFLNEGVWPPYSEMCADAYHQRTYEGSYWKKEATPLTVLDPLLVKEKIPPGLKDHLGQYFNILQINKSQDWFEHHPDIADRIKIALDQYADKLDPVVFPGVAVMVLNNDFETGVATLSQLDPSFANPDQVRALYGKFNSAFEKKESAELKAAIDDLPLRYCERFLTDEDELLHIEKYKERWGSSPESLEQFNGISLATFWSELGKTNPEFAAETLEQAAERWKKNLLPNTIPFVIGFRVNIPLLAEGTMHSGYFNAIQDTDGTIRRSRLISRQAFSYMPSLAFKTLLVDKGLTAIAKVDVENAGQRASHTKILKSLELTDSSSKTVMKLPVDHFGNLMINYSGPSFMFAHVGASQILSDSPRMKITIREYDPVVKRWVANAEKEVDKREYLKDKLLITGATATGIYDLRVTPFDENYPGVETHANVLSNLLVEYDRATGVKNSKTAPGFLRFHPDEEKIMWIVLLVLGLIMSGLLSYYGSVMGLGITALALALVYLVDKYYLFQSGIVTTVVFPVGLVGSNFVALTFYKYFGEEKKKRELKGTFEKYVSPSIVNEVLADPENIELGGKKMELTVMFSDVRGFTTISEKLDPRALSDLLNSYLTPMTNLVFKNKGTLDKYMGDAIMAFWGAPIHFKDHAKHACRCALEMLEKLKELQAEYRAKGLPEIDIGIGLNTGDMSVGNMGSDTVRSYTVMGDAVNLGSRLEGINKQYGTRIIVSEFTQKEIADSFVCREVDWVRVKGKAQPVRIFELIAEGKISSEKQQVVDFFNQGFALYHEKKFQEAIEVFNKILVIDANDAVTQLYLERCQDYLQEPPEENWDGVFTMKTK